MRNAKAFKRQLVVQHKLRPKVRLQQLAIRILQRLHGQRLARLGHLVRDFLKLGKHRLPDHRAADVVQLAVDQIGPLPVVAGIGQQMMAQQHLVERAGHFGHEDHVAVVLVRLLAGRMPGVHRVPRLVGQRKDLVEHVRLIVHQDIRRAVERAARKGPALLSLVRIAVAPPPVDQPLRQHAAILAPQRREGLDHQLHRLGPRPLDLQVAEDRHVRVVVVNVAELHLPPPHVIKPVHGRQVLPHRGDQVVIDRLRHVVGKQGRFERRLEIPHLGVIDVLVDRSGQRRGQRVLVADELRVVLMKGRLPHAPVRRHQELAERRIRQLDLLPLLVLHQRRISGPHRAAAGTPSSPPRPSPPASPESLPRAG